MATELDPFFYFHPSDNVAPNATWSVETGTEDPAYPASNVPDLTPALIAAPGKLLQTAGAWVGDFGAAQRVDLVVLWSDLDEAVSAACQMNATNSWGAPTLSEAFTIPARRADGYARKVFLDLREASGYTEAGLRYVRAVATGASALPIGIKILLFSRVRQLTRDFQWGVGDDEHQIGILHKTDAGVRWGYDLTSAPGVLKGSALLSDADVEAVREWFRACAGPILPTVIITEPTQNEARIVFWSPNGFSIEAPSLVVSRQSNTRQFADLNQTSLSFEDVAIGDPEWY